MTVTGGEIRELLGEHEGIRVHLSCLVKSRDTLAHQENIVLEHLLSYRCALYDFLDAVQYHVELDDRVFGALVVTGVHANPSHEHGEIRQIILEFINLVDDAIVVQLDPEHLTECIQSLGAALDKIRRMIDAHIASENAILEETLKKM